jgi:hypothetical protein
MALEQYGATFGHHERQVPIDIGGRNPIREYGIAYVRELDGVVARQGFEKFKPDLGGRHQQPRCYEQHAVRRQRSEQDERPRRAAAEEPLCQKRSERMGHDDWWLGEFVHRTKDVRAVVRQRCPGELLAAWAVAMSAETQRCGLARASPESEGNARSTSRRHRRHRADREWGASGRVPRLHTAQALVACAAPAGGAVSRSGLSQAKRVAHETVTTTLPTALRSARNRMASAAFSNGKRCETSGFISPCW